MSYNEIQSQISAESKPYLKYKRFNWVVCVEERHTSALGVGLTTKCCLNGKLYPYINGYTQ